jgi:hypothetical protein
MVDHVFAFAILSAHPSLLLKVISHLINHSKMSIGANARADEFDGKLLMITWLRSAAIDTQREAKSTVKDEANYVREVHSEAAKILDGVSRRRLCQSHPLSPATVSERASALDNRRESQRSRAYDNRNYVSGA